MGTHHDNRVRIDDLVRKVDLLLARSTVNLAATFGLRSSKSRKAHDAFSWYKSPLTLRYVHIASDPTPFPILSPIWKNWLR